MSILIIGSDGYLGNCLKIFLKKKQKKFFEEKYQKFLDYNINLEKYKRKINQIVHFGITDDLGNKKKIELDVLFAKKIGVFCRKNKIKFFYISSISAFKKNKSKYGSLKYQIENEIKKYDAIIIRPGMVWDHKAGSWFQRIEKLVKNCIFLMPHLGIKNKPVYLVYVKDLILNIFLILNKKIKNTKKNKIYVIANKKTYTLKEIVSLVGKKYNKKFIFMPIPFFLIKHFTKLLILLRIINYNFYDSCLSYQYNQAHKFKECIFVNTNNDFKNITKKN